MDWKHQFLIDNQVRDVPFLAYGVKEGEGWVIKHTQFLRDIGKLPSLCPETKPVQDRLKWRMSDCERFIVKNRSSMTRSKIAEILGWTPKMVKYRINKLIRRGEISPKIPRPEKMLSAVDWTEVIKNRAMELRRKFRKTNIQVCDILLEEFGFEINPPALQLWLTRFGCKGQTLKEWLSDNVPKYALEKMLSDGMLVVDISKHIQDTYGVRVGEDTVLTYIQENGLLSQKLRMWKDFDDRADALSFEELKYLADSGLGMLALCNKTGLSRRVLNRRFSEVGLNVLRRKTHGR